MADLSSYGPIFDDLGRGLRAAAQTREEGWSTLITLPRAFFESEPKNGLVCAHGFCHPAVFDEFARIDLNIGDGRGTGAPSKQEIVFLLEHHALPFLEGFGKVVCWDAEEDRVIFRSDFWNEIDGHLDAPNELFLESRTSIGVVPTLEVADSDKIRSPVGSGDMSVTYIGAENISPT